MLIEFNRYLCGEAQRALAGRGAQHIHIDFAENLRITSKCTEKMTALPCVPMT